MKRTTALLLCLTLICTLAITAYAASAHMSISSSSSTVYRGDTFTLTVSLSNDQPVSNGGIVLSYDSSVFELIGGSCNVSNATLAEVSAANGGGVFLLQSDAVVSGTIFTINMKVKSDAPFGSYTISGTPSLSISCSISGTGVTVACKHSYGNASQVDSANHESTCSICGETSKEAHTWDNGTVTKEPTCKDTGTKKLKCTGCGFEKNETVPVNDDHDFGDWSSLGSSDHARKCSVCGKEETDDHTWTSGAVIEKATCQTPGRQTVVCTGCGASAEREIPVTAHTYGTPTNATATQHTHKCTACGTVNTEAHSFGDEWEHDKQMHYYTCEICGYKKDQGEHKPGPKATEETDQICTVCQRILQPKGAHKHEFVKEWSSDERSHWHDCVDCPARDAEMPHSYDSDCDEDCNICGLTRQVTHLPIPVVEMDETGHWYPCLICGEKQDFAAHTPGPAATVTTAQTCADCGFEIAPVVPHDHVFDTTNGKHIHKCACGFEQEVNAADCTVCAAFHKGFPWWIVCIAEAVIFGIIIFFLLRKKQEEAFLADMEEEAEEEEAQLPEDVNELLEKLLADETPANKNE